MMDPKKVARAIKAIEREIAKLAIDETEPHAVYRKLDRLSDVIWKNLEGEARESAYQTARELRTHIGAACEQRLAFRRERNDAEIAELRAKHRAAQPDPGTFLHELALMRGRKS